MEKQSLSLKPIIKMSTFLTQPCLGSMSNGFGATESREVCMIFQSITMLLINLTY